ncbi:metal-dependent hydrolase [Skermanella stibiiresistens SB22]|uniref:Metal-dependent hydrolase n=1 Tax=Skermanella stibiiresistens SB22 TaxID=1385369 RepID=W9H1S1_9PROT|nr:metal-dependent hydrolase [Skermanella stibiiresistens]EWY38771.1 metal-dependent hydrolase [Skermanella stibiiresistens SB22]
MDSITQGLLGAVVGQVGFRRTLGRKAMVAGALLGTVPDLDVVASLLGPYANWLYHRGITHSIFFGPVVGPLFGWAIWRFYRWRAARRGSTDAYDRPEVLRAWIWLAILALFTHPIIDLFTSYGTQLLAPLSKHRFALDALPIIDPIYSLALITALIIGFAAKRRPALAVNSAAGALLFITAYSLMGWVINDDTRATARAQLEREGRPGIHVVAYPQLLQPWFRRVVAEAPDGLLVGYHSIWSDRPITWESHPYQRDPLIDRVAMTQEAGIFTWFAMGKVFWTVTETPTGAMVEAVDYRYGMWGSGDLGFWGIRAEVDRDGQILGPPVPFQRERGRSAEKLPEYWRQIWG